MRSIIHIAIPIILLLAGCGGNDASAASGDGPWTADAHTHASVARMRSVLGRAAIDPKEAEAKDYHELGEALGVELDALIQGCRMTGPDHDRLHAWLGPLTGEVRILRESQELSALAEAHGGVVDRLAEFQVLFPK